MLARRGFSVDMNRDPPRVRPGLVEIRGIFWILHSRGREGGAFEAQRISLRSLESAFNIYGITDHFVRMWYARMIFAMDDRLLQLHEAKNNGDA